MKKIEIGIFIILALGMLLRIIQLPGSGIFFVLGWSLLSIFYFYLSFAYLNNVGLRRLFKRESYSGIGASQILLGVAAGIALSILCIGCLFKMQFWPGADTNLLVGLVLTALVLIPISIQVAKNQMAVFKRALNRLVFFGAVGLFLFLISPDKLVELYYWSNSEYAEVYKAWLKDQDNEELVKELRRMEREDFWQNFI